MRTRRNLALAGATAALSLLTTGPALAAGPSVSVRIEGVKKTLLSATLAKGESGSITKGGAPAGTCSGNSVAGALDRATHHRWSGKYYTGTGIAVTSLLGESHSFTGKYYWSIWVDGVSATTGICDLKLHRGDRVLFAPAPIKGSVYPASIAAPAKATKGKAFKVTVTYTDGKGHTKALKGATIDGATTNGKGVAMLTAKHAGKLTLTASAEGYIRSEAVVSVS